METGLLYSSEQAVFPYRKKGLNRQSSVPRPTENLSHLHNLQAVFLQPHHPLLFHSYPPFSSQQQPPLLPLPLPFTSIGSINKSRARGLSSPPTNRKINKNTMVAKCKASHTNPKCMKPTHMVVKASPMSESSMNKPPKEVPKVVISLSSFSGAHDGIADPKSTKDLHEAYDISGPAVFTLSPPPSSLPLPTFSLRPKLSCNAEAAGFDAGATDKLRRLLRL